MKSQIDQEEDTCDNPCTCTVLLGKGHHMTRDLQPQRDIDRERERETEFASYPSYYFSHAQNLFTQTLLHRSCYTQTHLHTDAFAHRSVYTQTLLHTEAFTHRRFLTQTLDIFTQRRLLHTDAFARRH